MDGSINNTNNPPPANKTQNFGEQVIFGQKPIASSPAPYGGYTEDSGESFFSKKKISIVVGALVLIIIVFILYSVIGSRLKSSQNEDVSLIYWGLWEDPSVFASVISDFEREYPNIKVVYEKQDIKSLGKYVDRLNTRINNNSGPDIYKFHNSWLLQVKGLLLPFPSDLVSSSGIDTQYYDVVKKDLSLNGAYYGIPLGIDTLALFVNEEIFEASGITEYPTTWDDLSKISRSLTVKEEEGSIKTSGAALGTIDNIDHASEIISLLLIQNGADLKDPNGATKKNTQEALTFYTSFALNEGKVWDDQLESSKLAFVKGKLAMYFGYSWDVLEIKAMNPNLKFKVVSVPHLPARNSTIANYWAEGVSSKTKHPKEAFEFLKFLSKKETLQKLYSEQSKLRGFGNAYPRTDMADLLKDNPYIYPFVLQAFDARSTPFSSNTYDDGLNDYLNAYLGNAVRSILDNRVSVESAVETLAAGVTQVLGRYANPKISN